MGLFSGDHLYVECSPQGMPKDASCHHCYWAYCLSNSTWYMHMPLGRAFHSMETLCQAPPTAVCWKQPNAFENVCTHMPITDIDPYLNNPFLVISWDLEASWLQPSFRPDFDTKIASVTLVGYQCREREKRSATFLVLQTLGSFWYHWLWCPPCNAARYERVPFSPLGSLILIWSHLDEVIWGLRGMVSSECWWCPALCQQYWTRQCRC